MNMKVNHQITLPEKNEIYTKKDNEGIEDSISDIMSDLSNIIFQMNILFKKMRDLLNTYSQKQQILGWNIQVTSMQNKREAIDKTASGAITSGVCSIISGVASAVGAVASLRFGDIATHGGSALGQLGAGSGKLVEGDMARNADLLRMTSDLQSSSAQSYNKNISELLDKMNESRQNMKDFRNFINNMMGQISMAEKL
ncbi:chemotaxis protein [Yersinia kristensenii]|uniref:Methyl-accepting chemotaxis protein n=1 Tax=Yersinia kristensenii TaxID=28152 RepID=A0A0T9LSF6_YERKR|nr:chemotaxis protein [Yersinia kristensenii]MDA5521503.1 chemotaxis protein [Yersinia kristensenii]MDX6738012.1 chemotaxis protein [Yersinia kristensenii]PHZ35368.1 chemotaxis protein [Yersinia kristensenii]CNE77358.1 methyl-accepting chemotaxis protein [Yersinia kristensenii]CNF20292.1 methyl-accepting chemotaxis protein [Yersinia kristensenii]